MDNENNLFVRALNCLLLDDPKNKVNAVEVLLKEWEKGQLSIQPSEKILSLPEPGRPDKPELVDPKDVPRRKLSGLKGRLTLVHAITHIEFNAINLALDALYRFQDMPKQYYADWCLVASEEAQHFTMLSNYLNKFDMEYGDLRAHNGLWEMALKTDGDVLTRMALVPRVLEARGLDVTPGMIRKLQAAGDLQLVAILQKIFDDEIGHVKIGSHWYKMLCEQRGVDPQQTFLDLIDEHMQGAKFGPFETEARIAAGFSKEELQCLLDQF